MQIANRYADLYERLLSIELLFRESSFNMKRREGVGGWERSSLGCWACIRYNWGMLRVCMGYLWGVGVCMGVGMYGVLGYV